MPLTSMPLTPDPERRLSFRIVDNALIELVPVSEGIATDDEAVLNSLFPYSSQFELLNDLQHVDQELQQQLFKLSETSSVLAAALQLLNGKIDRLARQTDKEDSNQSLQPLSISEGGLAVSTQQPLAIDSLCALRIRLFPEGYALQTLAKVIYLLPKEGPNSQLGLQFVNLAESSRDLIARHILSHQAQQRRSQRLSQQQPEDEQTL